MIADADTGYGNPINVIRTVQEYEAAGVAAVHIEDQVMPKKCGHMEGKQLIGADEMVAKVEAAVAARRSPGFLIIARTDARAPEGLDARSSVPAPTARPEPTSCSSRRRNRCRRSRRSLQSFEDVPLLFNYAEGGKTPPVSHEQLRRLGFSIVIFPISTLLTATAAIRAALAQIKADGTPIELLGDDASVQRLPGLHRPAARSASSRSGSRPTPQPRSEELSR